MPDLSQKKIRVHLSELSPDIIEEINSLPMADRVKTLGKLGVDDSEVPQGGFFSRMLQGAPSEGMSFPDDEQAKMDAIKNHFALGGKMAAGAIPTLIGGGSPLAAIPAAALNAKYGPDPTSSEGLGQMLTQSAFSKFLPFLPGKGMNNLTNVAIGAGQGVAGNVATNAIQAGRGEQMSNWDPVAMGVQAILPAAANRLGNSLPAALERTPQAFRDKVLGIMGKLNPTIDVPEGQLPQVPQPQITQAPTPEITPKLANQMAKASKMNALLRNSSIAAEDAANMTDDHWAALEKAAGVSPSSPETRALTMKMLAGNAESPVPNVTAPTVKDSLTVQTPPAAQGIDELYKTATASQPLLKSGIKAADRQAIEGLMSKPTPDGAVVPRQPSEYISDLVDSNDWASLPKVMEKMDPLFKNGEFKKAVRSKIVENVLGAVGTEGPLGDLSVLKRIKTFHDSPVGGGLKGRDVLKTIFDGSPEAGANLESLHDLMSKSLDITTAEGLGDTVKAFLGPMKDPGNIAKNALTAGGAITFFIPMSFISGNAATAAGTAAGYRAFTLTSDVLADMIAKKSSKWATVLADGASGSAKHGYGTWKNIASALNLNSTDARTISKEQAEQEMERARRIANGEYE